MLINKNTELMKSYNIQVLRGIAIIAVVIIHNTPLGLWQVYCRPFLNFSVGLFLFLSGMLSDKKNWNPQKRIKKVIIPYCVWTLIYVVISCYRAPWIIPGQFILRLFLGDSAEMMYFCLVYIEFTLLIPVVDRLARSRYWILGFFVSPIEIVLVRLLPIIFGIQINSTITRLVNISFVGWFLYFYLGYLIGNRIVIMNNQNKTRTVLLIGYFVGMVLQVIESYFYLSRGEINCGTQLKLSSVFCGIMIVLLLYQWFENNQIKRYGLFYLIGNCSFGIFFCHMVIISIIKKMGNISLISIGVVINTYPVNCLVSITLSTVCVLVGKKILKSYGYILGF